MPFLPSLPNPAHLSDLYKTFPKNVQPLMEYTDGVLRSDGELSIAQRELIATFTSGLNACDFCFQSHLIYAQAFGIGEGVIEALSEDIDSAPVDTKLKPILHYVKKLNQLPSRIVEADAALVFEAGWGEQALYEAVQVCALFNMMNRIIEGTGVNFDYLANPEVHSIRKDNAGDLMHSYADFGKRVAALSAKVD